MSVFYVYLPVLVSAYLLTGLMALQPVFSIAGTMAILPQLGIGMAAVLLGGRHLLWGVFIGELLLQLLANHPLWTLPWYAAGQTAAVAVGAWLLGRGQRHDIFMLRTQQDVLLLLASVGLGVSVLAASTDMVLLGSSFRHGFNLWVAHTLGILAVFPLLLSWLRPCELQRPLNQAYFLEAGLLTASTVLIGAIVFLALLPWEMDLYPVVFAAFPFVGWAALRFALRGTSAVSLLLTGLAIIGTAQGVGAFHQGGMSQIWFFIATIVLSGLVFATFEYESMRIRAALAEEKSRFEAIFNAIPDAIVYTDTERLITGCNPSFSRIYGYQPDEMVGKSSAVLFADLAIFHDLGHALATTEDDVLEARDIEYVRKNGQIFHGETILSRFFVNAQADEQGIIGITRDITRRKRIEEQLRLASKVFENTAEGIVITDPKQRILSVNPSFSRITGYAPEEVLGNTPKVLNSGRQGAEFYRDMWQTLQRKGSWEGEIWNRRKNGEVYPEWLSINGVFSAEGQLTNYIAVFSDITRRKEDEQRLDFLSNHDPLTFLPNRKLLLERLDHAILQAQRYAGCLAILFIDLDRFKIINDGLGHQIGDLLLQMVAERLRESLTQRETVARIGGDEFAVLLDSVNKPEDAGAVAQRLLDALVLPIDVDGKDIFVTASIGVSVYPDDGGNAEQLSKNADIAMYRAKELGKNNFQYFASHINASNIERFELENQLRRALERQEIIAYYQPKIDVATERIVGMETLVRWQHPQRGLVSPAVFVPIAEETGLIVAIGEWILRQACIDTQRWLNLGLGQLQVAVNLSAKQFRQRELLNDVQRILASTGLPAAHLELEITESCVMDNVEGAIAMLHDLHRLGISLAIDDFGTGYSSLAYLKRFPVHCLKVDRSFICDLETEPDDAAITQAIISLAHSLNLKVVAEGVEKTAQLKFLREQGCDQYQGFYFSKPVPAATFEALLRQQQGSDAAILPTPLV